MISMTPYSLQKRIIFFAHGLMSHSNFGIIYIFNIWIPAYRSQYIEKIEREIQNRTNDSNYRYKKKSPETFDILQRIGDESLAIKHAQRLRESFSGTDYAAHKPCTTVYELVEELTHPEKLL